MLRPKIWEEILIYYKQVIYRESTSQVEKETERTLGDDAESHQNRDRSPCRVHCRQHWAFILVVAVDRLLITFTTAERDVPASAAWIWR